MSLYNILVIKSFPLCIIVLAISSSLFIVSTRSWLVTKVGARSLRDVLVQYVFIVCQDTFARRSWRDQLLFRRMTYAWTAADRVSFFYSEWIIVHPYTGIKWSQWLEGLPRDFESCNYHRLHGMRVEIELWNTKNELYWRVVVLI